MTRLVFSSILGPRLYAFKDLKGHSSMRAWILLLHLINSLRTRFIPSAPQILNVKTFCLGVHGEKSLDSHGQNVGNVKKHNQICDNLNLFLSVRLKNAFQGRNLTWKFWNFQAREMEFVVAVLDSTALDARNPCKMLFFEWKWFNRIWNIEISIKKNASFNFQWWKSGASLQFVIYVRTTQKTSSSFVNCLKWVTQSPVLWMNLTLI